MLWFDTQAKKLARLEQAEQKLNEAERALEEANTSKVQAMRSRVLELDEKKYQGGGLSDEEAAEYHRLDNSPEMVKLGDAIYTYTIVRGEYMYAKEIVGSTKPANPRNARTGGVATPSTVAAESSSSAAHQLQSPESPRTSSDLGADDRAALDAKSVLLHRLHEIHVWFEDFLHSNNKDKRD